MVEVNGIAGNANLVLSHGRDKTEKSEKSTTVQI